MNSRSVVIALTAGVLLLAGCKSQSTVNAEAGSVAGGKPASAKHFELRGFTTGMTHDQVIAKAKENGMVVYADDPKEIDIKEPGASTGPVGGASAVHPGMVFEIDMSTLTGRSMIVWGGMAGDLGQSILQSAIEKWGQPTNIDGETYWGERNGLHVAYAFSPGGMSPTRLKIVDHVAVNTQYEHDHPPAAGPKL